MSRTFVEQLGLTWNPLTTQIESHDWQAELYADVARFNRVLHNLCTDIWTYISLGYFVQVRGQGTVGSSTMPHKVNPIRFENAEANLEVSNALLDVLGLDPGDVPAAARPHRLLDAAQHRDGVRSLAARDRQRPARAWPASTSTPPRSPGTSTRRGRCSARRCSPSCGCTASSQPYERLKELTRGRRVDAAAMREFVLGLGLPDDAQQRLLDLTPATYTGLAERLVAHLDD